jgi:hypothetical protein
VYERLTAGLEKDHRLFFDAIQAKLRSHHAAFAEAAAEFCKNPSLAQAFRILERIVS